MNPATKLLETMGKLITEFREQTGVYVTSVNVKWDGTRVDRVEFLNAGMSLAIPAEKK